VAAVNGETATGGDYIVFLADIQITVQLIGVGVLTPTALTTNLLTMLPVVPSMSPYRVVIGDLFGTPIEELVVENLQYTYAMNDAGTCTFTVPTKYFKASRSLIDPGKRTILIYNQNTLRWGGYLWTVNASDEQDIQCASDSWFSRFKRRHVDQHLVYTGADQLDIAWSLIDFTQSKPFGDLGITRFNPSESSGVMRDREYFPYERTIIADDLINLAGVIDGFDFDINPQRQWKTFYPSRGSATQFTFELGKNVGGVSYALDATQTTSEMSAMGSGDADAMLISVKSDGTSLANYGLLQDTSFFRTVKNRPTLDAHSAEELRIRRGARLQPQLSVITNDPPLGSYDIGDQCLVRASMGYIQLAEQFRIIAITVAASNEGRDSVEVFFDQVISV
jgi:hypothetical protein